MKIRIEVDTQTLKELVIDHISHMLNEEFEPKDVTIEVMSNQNYRVKEWEKGEFRAIIVREK